MPFRAKEPFFAGVQPAPINPDDIYADDHPLVRQFPTMFVEVRIIEAPVRRRLADVEQATAAPGEKRQIKRG